jgi:phage tail sheath protein FI
MFKAVLSQMRDMLNVMPLSPAMAGIYAMVDNSINVAKAPANVSVGSVVSPTVAITNESQEDLNLPLNGKAVNAVRSFQGKGVLVWGARTLDGNSQDWRYLSVRRTMTFLEQSIKMAAEAYVFEPNNATTWTSLRAMVSNFLNNQWQGGILAGSTPDDAFSVEIGLGVTMTPNDILDGLLKMTVKVAITRPAEFIVITFQQQQQKS